MVLKVGNAIYIVQCQYEYYHILHLIANYNVKQRIILKLFVVEQYYTNTHLLLVSVVRLMTTRKLARGSADLGPIWGLLKSKHADTHESAKQLPSFIQKED